MNTPLPLNNPASVLGIDFGAIFIGIAVFSILFMALIIGAWVGMYFYRFRDREKRSLNSVLLQVAVSRSNEVKIDAMEQVFASLYAVKKGGWKQRFSTQPQISFEIVAKSEDIRFYVWTYKNL